jgi:hypothetical protein
LFDVVHAPLWLVALTAGVAAPFCVAVLQAALESKLRRTTQAVLVRATATVTRQPRERREEAVAERERLATDDPAR